MKETPINDVRSEEICLETIRNIDCITIIIDYPERTVIKDFRFKKHPQGLELATRTCEFLDGWKGYVYLEDRLPTLHLTKIDNKQIDLKIPLLKFGLLREAQLTYKLSFAQVIVKFEATLASVISQ